LAQHDTGQERKDFFFEKKKQKTFDHLRTRQQT